MVSRNGVRRGPAPSIIEGRPWSNYAGIDVSLESSSVCVVDGAGQIVREAKVASEPEALIAWFRGLDFETGADRARGRAVVAMALCGHAGGGTCGRAAGDPACARCVQDDAGQDRPQGRPRDRAADAAGLVPAGALQVGAGAGDAGAADRAQAGADRSCIDIEMSLRGILRGFGLKVGADDAADLSRRASASWWMAIRRLRLIAARAAGGADGVSVARADRAREASARSLARDDARARLLMSAPGVGAIVALTYVAAIDDPARFSSSKAGRARISA